MVLVGTHAGKDIVFDAGMTKYKFTGGKMELTGTPTQLAGVIAYLGRCYQAFPEGSAELRAAQEGLRNGGGKTDPNRTEDNAGGAGEGLSIATEAHDGSRGQQDDARKAGEEDAPGNGARSIAEALKQLDPHNDSHWNADGKPRMSAVEAFLGRTDVTRAQVEAVAPGLTREKVRGRV
jgi:hypothetical protein